MNGKEPVENSISTDSLLVCVQRRTLMRSYRKELWFKTPGRRAFLNITSQVKAALKESGVREGLALVNAMHITASVFINDDEKGLHADYDTWLERLAPHEPVSGYRHNQTGEDNADAHMKRQIMGREVVVAITAGELDFGPGSRFSTASSTAAAASACLSRLSANKMARCALLTMVQKRS
jgi:secondary thiamine-phosphate synthase enzyme